MRQEALEDVRREEHALPVVLARVLLAEVLGEDGDLLGPVAERRDEDIDDVEAVVEVLAEASLGDGALEVPVGGGDDADVDLDVAAGAQAGELASCRTCRSLACSGRGISPISSRKMVPPSASSNLPGLSLVGAGEGAALVAEELGLEQLAGQGGAVDLDEGALARAAERVVDGAGDELLADAGLAPDEDGDVGVGDLIDHLLDGLHARAVLEHPVVTRSGGARAGLGAPALGAARPPTAAWPSPARFRPPPARRPDAAAWTRSRSRPASSP